MQWRWYIHEFLATPAYVWLWCCAKIVGGEFVFYKKDPD